MLSDLSFSMVSGTSVFQNKSYPVTSGLKRYKQAMQKPDVLFLPAVENIDGKIRYVLNEMALGQREKTKGS